MTMLRDMHERLRDVEAKVDDADCPKSWWNSIELDLPILLVAVALTSYGCAHSSGVTERTKAFSVCAEAKDLTPSCQIILQGKAP